MVTAKRNLLLLVVTLAVAGLAAVPAFPDVNAEALQDEGLLDVKRDKRTLLLGLGAAGLGFGKGFVLGKTAGLALGKLGGGYGQGYGYYPTGGYNYYPQNSGTYYPQNSGTYYPQNSGTYYPQNSGTYYPNSNYDYNYPGGGYSGASSQAHAASFSGGIGPFHAGFSTADASAGSYGYGR